MSFATEREGGDAGRQKGIMEAKNKQTKKKCNKVEDVNPDL